MTDPDGTGARKTAITVVVADDHPLFREALAQLVRRDPRVTVVATASDGQRALDLVREHEPDVVLLDVRMPLLTGPEVAQRLARDQAATRVLFLSEYEDGDRVYAAIESGAAGYITKAASPDEILDAVLAVARGDSVLSPGVSAGLVRQIHARASPGGPDLTRREQEVLALMVEGCTSRIIGERLHLATATVKTHTQSIFSKLGVSHRAAAVAEAMRLGLVD